jgi:uncharacterized membrane protein
MTEQRNPFSRKDLIEIVVGACTLALPLAVTEEVRDLGKELHILNVLVIVAVSYSVIAYFVRSHFYGGKLTGHHEEFVKRVLSVYVVTLTVAAVCLLAVDKLPLLSDPVVALKRTVLTSLPASFVATVVDGLHYPVLSIQERLPSPDRRTS